MQIGQPVVQKGLVEAVVRARDARLYHAITDCGAGGLSSAVGEMARGLGADVELERVPLKQGGLSPREIWLSEAQERMVLAVPPAAWAQLVALCQELGVEASLLGRFRSDGRLRVSFQGREVVNLPLHWLHTGRPPTTLPARYLPKARPTPGLPPFQPREALLGLLSHPNLRSREAVIRQYDHMVQGGTVQGPLVEPAEGVAAARACGPADGVVLSPLEAEGRWGLVVGHGINPWYGELDPRAMAWAVVDEAVRNVVAAGADAGRIALLDNFCWGDVRDPQVLGALVRACQGAYEAARSYGLPFISGKDSLNNAYRGRSIPGTLLVTAVGFLPDLGWATTPALKRPGSRLYLVGEGREELGGSHLALLLGVEGGEPPQPAPWGPAAAAAVHRAIAEGRVLACHDVAEGGLAVALVEMALGGELGFQVEARDLFGETPGRYVLEVARGEELRLAGVPTSLLGEVTEEASLRFSGFELSLAEARQAWAG